MQFFCLFSSLFLLPTRLNNISSLLLMGFLLCFRFYLATLLALSSLLAQMSHIASKSLAKVHTENSVLFVWLHIDIIDQKGFHQTITYTSMFLHIFNFISPQSRKFIFWFLHQNISNLVSCVTIGSLEKKLVSKKPLELSLLYIPQQETYPGTCCAEINYFLWSIDTCRHSDGDVTPYWEKKGNRKPTAIQDEYCWINFVPPFSVICQRFETHLRINQYSFQESRTSRVCSDLFGFQEAVYGKGNNSCVIPAIMFHVRSSVKQMIQVCE